MGEETAGFPRAGLRPTHCPLPSPPCFCSPDFLEVETDGVVCLPVDRGECAHLKVLLSSSFLQGSKRGWGWGWGKYYVDKRAAQKQNLPQSRELEEGTGGAGSQGPLGCVGVVCAYVFCLRGAERMTTKCCSPLIGHHLRHTKKISHMSSTHGLGSAFCLAPMICWFPGGLLQDLTPTLSSSAPSNIIYLFLLCV